MNHTVSAICAIVLRRASCPSQYSKHKLSTKAPTETGKRWLDALPSPETAFFAHQREEHPTVGSLRRLSYRLSQLVVCLSVVQLDCRSNVRASSSWAVPILAWELRASPRASCSCASHPNRCRKDRHRRAQRSDHVVAVRQAQASSGNVPGAVQSRQSSQRQAQSNQLSVHFGKRTDRRSDGWSLTSHGE
jgi:hypothetical protein